MIDLSRDTYITISPCGNKVFYYNNKIVLAICSNEHTRARYYNERNVIKWYEIDGKCAGCLHAENKI